MPRVIWKHRLDLRDIFHSEAHGFINRRDIIVARVQRAKFWTEDDAELIALTEELSESRNADEFNSAWEALYDWFHANRVWVATI